MKTYKCPVCGTQLTSTEYEKALGLWKEKQQHIHHLEQERKKLLEQKRLYEKKINEAKKLLAEERKRLRAESQKMLNEQKSKLIESFNRKMNLEIKKRVEDEVKVQKKQLEKQIIELRKTQNKMKQLQESLRSYAEKNQKANEEIKRLKTQLEKGITPQIEGLLEEKNLLEKLQQLYPTDKFFHTGKGGDIIQIVIKQKREIGRIIYECKKVKNFDKKFIEQAKTARKKREADFAVLVTNTFPGKKQYYFVEKTVFVISPVSLEPITYILRESLLRIEALKLSNQAKEKAVQMIYDYLSGSEYNNKMNEVAQELIDLGKELKKEMLTHKSVWLKRYNAYKNIFYDMQSIDNQLKLLLTTNLENREHKLIESAENKYIQITELEK